MATFGPYELQETLSDNKRGAVYRARGPRGPALLYVPVRDSLDRSQLPLSFVVHTSTSPSFWAIEIPSVIPEMSQKLLGMTFWRFLSVLGYLLKFIKLEFVQANTAVKPAPKPKPKRREPQRWVTLRSAHVLGGVALLTGAVALVVALFSTTPAPKPADLVTAPSVAASGGVDPAAGAGAGSLWALPTALPSGSGIQKPQAHVFAAVPMPPQPLPGQERPPCALPEKEVNGGCWFELSSPAPCPDNIVEYKGRCYIPARPPIQPPKPGTSLTPETVPQ